MLKMHKWFYRSQFTEILNHSAFRLSDVSLEHCTNFAMTQPKSDESKPKCNESKGIAMT